MVDGGNGQFDVLLERALNEFVFHEDPPDRVWENIVRRVRGRDEQPRSRLGQLRELASEAMVWAGGAAATARIVLTPTAQANGERWAEWLMLAGHSSAALRYSINH